MNISRGPIVEEAALVEALRSGQLAGAGLDVFDREPLPADHPFRSLDNVVVTPHIGYVTEHLFRTAWHADGARTSRHISRDHRSAWSPTRPTARQWRRSDSRTALGRAHCCQSAATPKT